MKRIIVSVSLIFLAVSSFGQRISVSERWVMNERLLDLADSYERSSRFSSRSDRYTFLSLFRSPDVPVWCDYMASAEFGEQVPVSRYIEISQDFEDRSVQISNFVKGPVEYRDGRWHARFEFDKRVEYEDSLGFTFSTLSPQAGGDYHMIADCVWDKEEEEFRIENLSGSENASFRFPRGNFHIVQQKNEIDTRVLYDGRPLEFNEYGFTVLPDGGTFGFDDDDYVLTSHTSPGNGRYDIYSFSLKPKKFRVRAGVTYTLNPLDVSTVYDTDPSSSAVEFGVSFGYAFSLGRSFKYVPYFGAGISRSWFSMGTASQLGEPSVSYTFLEGTALEREYNIVAKDDFSLMDATISLVPVSFELNLGKAVSVILDAGVKTYLNLSASEEYNVTASVPSDFNLQPGFKAYNDTPIGPRDGDPNFWTLSLLARTGVDVNLSSGLFAFLHAGVEYGLGSDTGALRNTIYSYDGAVSWLDAQRGIYPVIYRNSGESIQDINYHSFKSSITSIKRGLGITIEAGVRLKF